MDRKLLLGLALIFAIFMVPTLIMKRQMPPPVPVKHDSVSATLSVAPASASASTTDTTATITGTHILADSGVTTPGQVVVVRSKLYRFAISTRGGRIVSSRFLPYLSMTPADNGDTLDLVAPGDAFLGGTILAGADTINLDRVNFTASADSLSAAGAPATLTLHGIAGAHTIDLRYTFAPDDYRIAVSGQITGLGATGATYLVNLGNGFRNTESNAADNLGQSGFVTKQEKTVLTHFSQLKPHETRAIGGPFEWVAVKSKYFVSGFFAYDSTAQGIIGKVTGLLAVVSDSNKTPTRARVAASLTLPVNGMFSWQMYIGPMEYDRLHHAGRDFDDVNPYGWSWIRWLVRPIAVWIRAIFVWMHQSLGLGYGLVIVLFGIAVRVLLWPLNRIAMRSMARMQALQPEISALQERYKDNPQMLQQETMRLYKVHGANPFGGCWPMLLPYPLLIAVFFVLAYTIEVRGVHFLWMTDLAQRDPLYIMPMVMAASMYVVSRISQRGLPPNPQTQMMTWLMPIMMLVLFGRFAAGLNLYYTVQNIMSIPQQWLIMQERLEAKGKPIVGKK